MPLRRSPLMQVQPSCTIISQRPFTFEDFRARVRAFDYVGTLMSLQKLSAILSNQSAVNIRLEFEFHTGPRVQHRILLRKDFIPFFAKQCILNCGHSELQYNDLDLTNLAYEYGNMETDLAHTDPASDTAWLWVLRATNCQWHYLRLPSSIMGRYLWLFRKVFESKPALNDAADRVLGLDFFDTLKIGTCIFSNFFPKPDGFATSFDIRNYIRPRDMPHLWPLLTEEKLTKFLAVFSADQDQFQAENSRFEIQDSLLKTYEFNPLRRFPIIKTNSTKENERYIIPSLPDFFYGCFEGMYYVLLDKFERTDKEELFQAFGEQFENYIGELMRFYNVPVFTQAELLPEQSYNDGSNQVKSADWLLVGEEYIFQIECKKRKPDTSSKVGLEGEGNAGISGFLQSVAEEVDKFPKKERHIRDDKVDKVAYSGQKFVNIIVYLDEMFALNEHGRAEIRAKMQGEAETFYILGCHEFELLCQHANDKNMNLKTALEDVLKKRTNVYSIAFLEKNYDEFFNSVLG